MEIPRIRRVDGSTSSPIPRLGRRTSSRVARNRPAGPPPPAGLFCARKVDRRLPPLRVGTTNRWHGTTQKIEVREMDRHRRAHGSAGRRRLSLARRRCGATAARRAGKPAKIERPAEKKVTPAKVQRAALPKASVKQGPSRWRRSRCRRPAAQGCRPEAIPGRRQLRSGGHSGECRDAALVFFSAAFVRRRTIPSGCRNVSPRFPRSFPCRRPTGRNDGRSRGSGHG